MQCTLNNCLINRMYVFFAMECFNKQASQNKYFCSLLFLYISVITGSLTLICVRIITVLIGRFHSGALYNKGHRNYANNMTQPGKHK